MVKRLVGIILCIALVASLSISSAFAAAKTTTVNATISNAKITFNGYNLPILDEKAKPLKVISYNGYTYIPLKAFASAIGLQYSYDSKIDTINLDNKYSLIDAVTNLVDPNKTFNNNAIAVTKTKTGHAVKIDKNKLPTIMKGFKKVSVSGFDSTDFKSIANVIFSNTYIYKHCYMYDENTGFLSGNVCNAEMVLLYDDNEELLGYSVIYLNGNPKSENNKQNSSKVSLNNYTNIFLDGTKIQPTDGKKQLDPINYNGYLYFPLRQLVEAMGINVSLDSKNNTILLTNKCKTSDITKKISSFDENFINVDSAITFSKPKGTSVTINVDRSKLTDKLKKFKKIFVCSVENETEQIGPKLFQVLLSGYNTTDYNDKTGIISKSSDRYRFILLYDDNNNLLGYSIIDVLSKIDNTPVKITVSPVDATPKEKLKYPSFNNAIILIGNVPKNFKLKIDRSKLPDSMKNFTNVSATGCDNNSTDFISKYILNDGRYGTSYYNDFTGLDVNNSNDGFYCLYRAVVLYDKNNHTLGYSIIEVDSDKTLSSFTQDFKVDAPKEPPKINSKYTSFSGGITLDGNVPNEYRVKIDRNVLPNSMKNFTRISVTSCDDVSDHFTNTYILDGTQYTTPYDSQNGYGVINTGSGSPAVYNVVILYDNNDKILGFSIIIVK